MSTAFSFPDGFWHRPLVKTDARAVYELMAAQELADLGVAEIEEADIVADWARPSYDLESCSVGVFDGDRLVGYAEVVGAEGRGDAAVHPDYRDRGLGRALSAALQQLARARGASIIGLPVPAESPGDRLLASLGYRVRWTSWVLELPPGEEIPARPLPDGYRLAVATPDRYEQVWTVIEDAFLEWSERERQSYDDFVATVLGRPGCEPWHIRVVLDPDDRVVAVSTLQLTEGMFLYVARLATAREHRGRGLAQSLLVDSFAAGREHGATRFELATDSRTGALALYEKVGMRVRQEWVHRAIDLT